MTISPVRYYLLVAYAILMTCVCLLLAVLLAVNEFHTIAAHQQIADYERFCSMAENGTWVDAESALNQLREYYPSGTLQVRGSALDHVVEASRKWAAAAIMLELQKKAGNSSKRDLNQ